MQAKEHFCAVVEEAGGLVKQLSYLTGPGLHPKLPTGQAYVCLSKEEYGEIQDGIQEGRVFRVQGPQRNVPRGHGTDAQVFGREAPEKEVQKRLTSPPTWKPDGLPPVTFRAFGRELRQLSPGSVVLTWDSGPLQLAINGEDLECESPLELVLKPGDYRIQVADPRFQPANFHLSVFNPT